MRCSLTYLRLNLGRGEREGCSEDSDDDGDDGDDDGDESVLPDDGVEDLDDILNENWISFSLVFALNFDALCIS